jgi:hypothetical protein
MTQECRADAALYVGQSEGGTDESRVPQSGESRAAAVQG